jgi:hypothetical protein
VDRFDWVNVETVEVSGVEIISVVYCEDDTIFLTYSWDEGQTWQNPTVLSSGNDMLPGTSVTSDSYVHSVWEHNTGSDQVIEYIRAHYVAY